MNCNNCKWHRIDTLSDRTKEDYCYPPILSDLLSAPCKERKKNHKKQCLWLNNKISFAKMIGQKGAYSSMDFKF